jgi:hypothetical protein
MYQIIASPLRSNYSYQQIRKDEWKYEDKFQSLALITPSMTEWSASLKINGKTIALENVDQDVWVDGVKLTFAQMINVRKYIRETYFPRSNAPVYSIFEPTI